MTNEMKNEVKGYKVFNPDWTCRGKQYTCPGIFKEELEPVACERGMHFCEKAVDCFNYYDFNPDNRVAEVVARGTIDETGDKCCTDELEIIREIPWLELLEAVNAGKCCTGRANSGDWNSGHRNLGDWNSGSRNSGDWNSGSGNSGDRNSGHGNTGNRNSGNENSGDWNSGDWNSGSGNSGDRNSGHGNTGNRNSGNENSGDWNSGGENRGDSNAGDRNEGDWNSGGENSGHRNSGKQNRGDLNSGDQNNGNKNSGNWNMGYLNSGNGNLGSWNSGNGNTGDRNSGHWNAGNRNSGDWNKTNFSNGCFNTVEPKIYMFDRPSEWTYRDWLQSDARALLNRLIDYIHEYVPFEDMTDEEKEAYPSAETTGGYPKNVNVSECIQRWWDELSGNERRTFVLLPNFDNEIFKKITGIDVYKFYFEEGR